MKSLVVLVVVLLACSALFVDGAASKKADEKKKETGPKDLARGWGDDIKWYSWADGLAAAKKEQKPLMLVLHKTWCGACKSLKPQFAKSAEIQKLSANFIMVNAEDDEAPHSDSKFQIDGGYIPRIYFVNSKGEVDPTITNAGGNPQYKYYFPSPEAIVAAMKQAVSKLGGAKVEL